MCYIEVPLYKRALIDTGFRSVWCSALLFNLSGFFVSLSKQKIKFPFYLSLTLLLQYSVLPLVYIIHTI